MKERPILLNAEMVRAVLDGRKTQMRRVMKAQPHAGVRNSVFVKSGFEDGHGKELVCPFGAVGDRLWVRETFAGHYIDDDQIQDIKDGRDKASDLCEYRADYPNGAQAHEVWTPSIHMPRWASRITLEITGVRVERLNSISEEDAAAEGVGSAVWFAGKGVPEEQWTSLGGHGAYRASHINSFASLWESIHGEKSWQANPLVWVIEFKRVEANHDN